MIEKFLFKFGGRMPVGVCAVRSDMVVSVGMRDRMRVDVAAVEMREGVPVRIGVVTHERIDDDKRRPRDHHAQRREIHPRQPFLQQDEREQCPHERRNSIVGARFRRPERVLRANVKEDAESVGHKAERKRDGDMREAWHCLMPDDGDRKRAESGEHAFQDDSGADALRS